MLRTTYSNEDCPSNDYTPGEPNGKCWGDGHYMCLDCKHYRADFKKYGMEYIDFVYGQQAELQFINIEDVY